MATTASGTRLQVAFDFVTSSRAVEIIPVIEADIIEVGTSMIKREGISVIAKLKAVTLDKLVVADLKIADDGQYEAAMAFDAGAGIVSVLASAPTQTIEAVVHTARSAGGLVVADLLGVRSKPACAKLVERLGVDMICVHTGRDERVLRSALHRELESVRQHTTLPIAVAGGINPTMMPELLSSAPDVVIVGQYIVGSADPAAAAAAINNILSA